MQLHIEGRYKLSDELRAAGTVPQFAGEHICSLKFKAWVIETWLEQHIGDPSRHAFGYNAEETKRVAKSDAAFARRIAFGFNSEEAKRVLKAVAYDTPKRQSFYPLVDWEWNRSTCIDYLRETLGVEWQKSSCVYCPFNALKPEAIERHKRHPDQVGDALMLERVSLSLNPRGRLYRDQSLLSITDSHGNELALDRYRAKLEESQWAVYRVRRIYQAGKDKLGAISPNKKGHVLRAVEQLTPLLGAQAAADTLNQLAGDSNQPVEEHGITYFYRHRCEATFPTREEFLVALPAVVESKARHGLDWFEEKWGRQRRESTTRIVRDSRTGNSSPTADGRDRS